MCRAARCPLLAGKTSLQLFLLDNYGIYTNLSWPLNFFMVQNSYVPGNCYLLSNTLSSWWFGSYDIHSTIKRRVWSLEGNELMILANQWQAQSSAPHRWFAKRVLEQLFLKARWRLSRACFFSLGCENRIGGPWAWLWGAKHNSDYDQPNFLVSLHSTIKGKPFLPCMARSEQNSRVSHHNNNSGTAEHNQ